MIDIENIARIADREAKNLGIARYDISGSATETSSVKVRKGEAEQLGASQRRVVTVRVWDERGVPGVATTTELNQPGLALALRTARETARFGALENAPEFSPEALAPLPADARASAGLNALEPLSDMLARLVAAEKSVLDAHSAIESVPYNGLSRRNAARFYISSEGAARYEDQSDASVFLYAKTEAEGKKPRSAGAFEVGDSLARLDVDACVKKVIDKTLSHLDYKKIPSGKYTVVFSAEAFLSLLDAFSNLFDAQRILDKQSLSTPGTLGTRVASDIFGVWDDAHHPTNPFPSAFDGEGTPTRRTALIEGGRLTGLLHSEGTARRMGASPTGHARMGSKISVGAHYYVVAACGPNPGSRDLRTEDRVVYVDEVSALHAGVNALQGSFSVPFSGWLHESGKRTSIESATVAGDWLSVLASIVHLGETPEATPSGTCPDVWVTDLSVTSEA